MGQDLLPNWKAGREVGRCNGTMGSLAGYFNRLFNYKLFLVEEKRYSTSLVVCFKHKGEHYFAFGVRFFTSTLMT